MYYRNNFIWHTNPQTRVKVDEFNEKAIAVMRGPNQADYVDFVNGTRVGPIERRFRSVQKTNRLRELKKIWDPTGVFTDQLLQ